MLVGLRKAWAERLREELATSESNPSGVLFHHENLQAYRKALAFMEWFVSHAEARDLSNRLFKQIDEAATSVVLNTAEGNGRYAELDQLHFIDIAQKGAVKAMVYLDLCVARKLISTSSITRGKEIIGETSAMLGGF